MPLNRKNANKLIIIENVRIQHFCLKIGHWKSGAYLKWLTVLEAVISISPSQKATTDRTNQTLRLSFISPILAKVLELLKAPGVQRKALINNTGLNPPCSSGLCGLFTTN